MFWGTWQTPQVLSQRPASSGVEQSSTPTAMMSAHVLTVCMASSLSKQVVSATHGEGDGGGLASGHCTALPVERRRVHGGEWGSCVSSRACV
jgi:hypothetical protein